MPATYDCIATTTLSSNQNSVTFSSISGNYTDLILVSNVKATGNEYMRMRVGNSSVDTGSNYSATVLSGNGSAAASYRYSNITNMPIHIATVVPSSDFTVTITQLQNYSNTTTFKTVLNRSGYGSSSTEASVSLWRSTSAINIITIYMEASINIASGSTFTLYGIKAA